MIEPGALPGALVTFLDNTLGAIEIGVFISSLLFGLNCGQVYSYATNARRSSLMTGIVASIAVLESIHLLFMWLYFFNISVTNFGNPFTIGTATFRFGVLLTAHALLVAIIESFFCYRIWILSRSLWLAVPPAVVSLARGCITIALSVVAVNKGIALLHDKYGIRLFYATLIISALLDAYISVSLCVLLWRKKSGLESTRHLVNGIIYWTIETGLLTTITAISILLLFMCLPFTGYWNAFLLVYTRLYTNSFLISLGAFRDRATAEGSRCGVCLADPENPTLRKVATRQTPFSSVYVPESDRLGPSEDEPPPLPEKTHGALILSWPSHRLAHVP